MCKIIAWLSQCYLVMKSVKGEVTEAHFMLILDLNIIINNSCFLKKEYFSCSLSFVRCGLIWMLLSLSWLMAVEVSLNQHVEHLQHGCWNLTEFQLKNFQWMNGWFKVQRKTIVKGQHYSLVSIKLHFNDITPRNTQPSWATLLGM